VKLIAVAEFDRLRTYFVKPTTDIDRRLLDDAVDDFRERSKEIGGVDFGVEENLWCKEPFIANVEDVFLGMNKLMLRRY
jgi:hypothetical protein